jgi:phosphoglycolate phosphatase-like HAD superfamily hydrolase
MGATLTRPEAMLFDLDGTLFKTETLLLPAYHQVFDQLRKEGLYKGETPPEERILDSLGLLLEEIWRRVIPDEPQTTRDRANVLLLQYQLEGMKNGIGELYPGVGETLRSLHERGVRLFVASNGLEGYVKGVVFHQGLSSMIEGVYSAGEFGTRSKADLVRKLMQDRRIQTAWMVGDRSSDVEAGRKNGLPVIGCNYAGFGQGEELAGANAVIRSFDELLPVWEQAALPQ